MTRPRILIACIGNIFLGDDGFGVAVAQQLLSRQLPLEVRVSDFGIRGFDLAYALLDNYEVTIFVDATPRGKAPGTLYVLEPDLSVLNQADTQAMIDETHGMNPMKVLAMVKAMDGELKKVLLVGCEPETLGGEEGQLGLSDSVAAAVNRAVELIESLVAGILEECQTASSAQQIQQGRPYS
jgi:hydrogenase maturation protease